MFNNHFLDHNEIEYRVHNKVFYNSVDAIIEASRLNVKVDLYFPKYKFLYKPELWKKEPPKTLRYYLLQHAEFINSNYDNIIIPYSGGTDSHTILDIFISAGIRNVTLVNGTMEETKFSPNKQMIQEETKKSLKIQYESIFKELNYTFKEIYYQTSKPKDWLDAIENFKGDWATEITIPTNWARTFHEKHKIENIIKGGKRNCLVWGHEKPRLTVKNGWWCWYAFSGQWTVSTLPTDFDYDNINFFLTNNVPEIQIKLAWRKACIIEKIMKENNIPIDENTVNEIQHQSSNFYQTINHYMGYQALNFMLDSNIYKGGGALQTKTWNDHYKAQEKNGILQITNEYFDNVIKPQVNENYLDREGKRLYTPEHQPIPIRPLFK